MIRIVKHIGISIWLASVSGIAMAQAVPALSHSSRIVGGINMQISSAPATVAMINNDLLAQSGSFFQSQFCGATVIASRWALTAAHCVVEASGSTPASTISILMGATDLNEPVNQPVGIRRIVPHPQYATNTQTNDIALLELEYDALVNPAALDLQNVALNDDALIAGWGALNMGNQTQQQRFPTKLQGAFVKMIPGDECGTLFPRYSQQVNARQLCAGVPAGGVDSCQGDSGGPLYRASPGNRGEIRITGITSWGHGCAEADAPGVYTRVAAYASWISQNTGIDVSGQALVQQPQQDDPRPTTSPLPVATTLSNLNNAPGTTSLSQSTGGGANGYWVLSVLGLLVVARRVCRRADPKPERVSRVCDRPHPLTLNAAQ